MVQICSGVWLTMMQPFMSNVAGIIISVTDAVSL